MCLCFLQSTFTMEGDKLVQVQKWDGKETRFVREIKDGKMVMVRCSRSPTVASADNRFSAAAVALISQCGDLCICKAPSTAFLS